MKKISSVIFFSAFLLGLFPFKTIAQPVKENKAIGVLPAENVVLFTDRNLYATGESIKFSAHCTMNREYGGKDWSTVLYLELTDQMGQQSANGKYPLSAGKSSGELSIPDDIPSGVYYLKAYTRWMRNFSVNCYFWQKVKIINPFSVKVVTPANATTLPASLKENNLLQDISCSAGKEKYMRREPVEISLTQAGKSRLASPVSVTVIKEGLTEMPVIGPRQNENTAGIRFFPDIRGNSISGKIVDQEGNPVENALVQLSLLNKKSFYSGYYSGKNGEFLFSLPDGQGKHDFYIEAKKEDQSLKISLDDEFCSRPVNLQPLPFELTPAEKEAGYEMCLNQQISTAFAFSAKSSPEKPAESDDNKLSFYGEPVKTIYTKKYINLPDLKEFIFELVPEFTIEYFRKAPLIKPVASTSFTAWPALVMIDNVPVTDLAKFLALPVDKIERLELIDKGYVSGDLKHNGIIHAFSKNRDLAGIDLPKNSLFFSSALFSPSEPYSSPDYSDKKGTTRIPDRRNTLYWNPEVSLSQGTTRKLTFYTADLKGSYEVLVRGLSAEGEIVTGRTSFRVE